MLLTIMMIFCKIFKILLDNTNIKNKFIKGSIEKSIKLSYREYY